MECFGPLLSRWSGDGGVRLTVSPSYSHSHRPLPKNTQPSQPSSGTGSSTHLLSLSHRLLVHHIETGMLSLLPTLTFNGCQWVKRGKDRVTFSRFSSSFSDKWINIQADSQTDNKLWLIKDPWNKATGRNSAYFRLTIVLIYKSAFVCDHNLKHAHTHSRTSYSCLNHSSEKVPSWLCYTGTGRGGFEGQMLKQDNLSGSLMSLSLLLARYRAADCTTSNKVKLAHYGNNCSA